MKTMKGAARATVQPVRLYASVSIRQHTPRIRARATVLPVRLYASVLRERERGRERALRVLVVAGSGVRGG